jgi:hypothetical protein
MAGLGPAIHALMQHTICVDARHGGVDAGTRPGMAQ